jgi:hypothetical protein
VTPWAIKAVSITDWPWQKDAGEGLIVIIGPITGTLQVVGTLQPKASVIMTEYVPAAKPVRILACEVNPDGPDQLYV